MFLKSGAVKKMQVLLSILFLMMASTCLPQQLIRDSLFSTSLQKEVSFEVWLPKNYSNTEKHLVLYSFCYDDFDMYCGILSSFVNFNRIPPVIAVNAHVKFTEYGYNYASEKLSKKGDTYTAFLTTELIPYIEKKYNTSDFRIALGHSYTAAYANYLLKNNPGLFRGYIAISHEKPEIKIDYTQSIKNISTPSYYFLATAGLDLPKRIQFSNQLYNEFIQVKNQNLKTKISHFATADHNSVRAYAFTAALEFIFKDYISYPDHSPDDYIKDHKIIGVKEFFNKTMKHNEYYYSYGLNNSANNINFFLELASANKDTAAFTYIENYSLLHNPDGNILEFLGYYNNEAGNAEKAKALFYRSIKKYKEDNSDFLYNVHYALANLYKDHYKNPEMAIKTLQEGKTQLDDPIFDMEIAGVMISMDYKLEDAPHVLQEFLANKNYSIASSEYPLEYVYYQLARCYTKLKNIEKAKDYVRKALETNPDYTEAKALMKTFDIK